MNIKCQYLSIQELGKRSNQEDSLYPKLGDIIADNDLFILCDGMGGHEHGEVASQTVCESMSSYIKAHPDAGFEAALSAAYDALDAADKSKEKKMGTTLTLLKFENESCIVAHIGDSRIYQIRPSEKRIIHVTRDHSLVNDLIACGELTPEEAKNSRQKNVITRAMQPNQPKRTKADVAILTDIKVGDYFYMCSDGMLEISEDSDIVNVISMDISDEEKIEILRGVTADNMDNHTAHLIRVTETGKKKTSFKTSVVLVPVLATALAAGCLWYASDRNGDIEDMALEISKSDTTATVDTLTEIRDTIAVLEKPQTSAPDSQSTNN